MRRARWSVPFHAAVAVVLTWPLAAHLTTSLPYGTEDVQTVPLFNLWTLRWNQLQLADLLRSYWDAPIFHPTPGAFALSEPQPLTGLFFAPISWVSGNPVLAYGVTLLTIITLNGWAAARLARRLGVAPWAAALAGVLAQALPFVSNQLGVLQLTVLFPILLLADALLRWAPEGGWRPALAIGGWLAAIFLTCGYYGLFTVVVVPPAALTLVRRSWLRWPALGWRVRDLAVALAVFVVLAGPFLVGQARYTEPYQRAESTIEGLSALPVDFVRLHPDAHGAAVMPWLADEGGTAHWLYPGTVLLVLAAIGLVTGVGSRRADRADRDDRDEPGLDATDAGAERAPGVSVAAAVAFFGTAAALALVLSFGLRLHLGGLRPYDLLRDHVPGYRDLRSPYRFAVLFELFLVPLAALGLDRVWRWDTEDPTAAGTSAASGALIDRAIDAVLARVGPIVAVTVVLIGVLEVSALPQRLFDAPPTQVAWASWLAAQPPPPGGAGAVAMVPFPADGSVESYEPTTQWMLLGLDHGHPLVNGYSGLFPPSYDELEAEMRAFPEGDGPAMLRAHGVRWVVIMRSWLTGVRADEVASLRGFTVVHEDPDAVVYQLD